jgi:outer membrane protein assembly factor BamB
MKSVSKLFILFFLFQFILTSATAQVFPTIKWYFDVNDMAFGNSACADLDFDDTLEVTFSCYRNDSMIYVLNGEDGSLLWKYNTGGCSDAAPLIFDVDQDDSLEIVLASSCNPTTFCFKSHNGDLDWSVPSRGSDSPPSIADIDNDGKLEILHGEFGGYVKCIAGESGIEQWDIPVDVNSWIQTAPAILDVDTNGQLDFVVANWSFGTNDLIAAYRGDNHALIWDNYDPNDYMYHGASFTDLEGDGTDEIIIGCYDGKIYCFNAEDGSTDWSFSFPTAYYVGGPTSVADLNNDNHYEIVFFDWFQLGVLSDTGTLVWNYSIPNYGSSFRGAAIADINADDTLDIVFGTSKGEVIALNGSRGNVIWTIDLSVHYGDTFEIDHAPIIADIDNDGYLDVFVVGGQAHYPNIYNNYGRAYALSAGTGTGDGWNMFRHDERRSGCIRIDSTSSIETNTQQTDITIYPNPAHNYSILKIKHQLKHSNLPFEIFDISGRMSAAGQTDNNQIDLSDCNLRKGSYIVKLFINNSQTINFKLLVI